MNGFDVANKKESQEICFVSNDDYVLYIENKTGIKFKEGNIVNKENVVLGRHRGIIRYTIGQRRGLGISSKEPLYVIKLDKEKNLVIVSSENDIYEKEVIVDSINLQAIDEIYDGMEVMAKIRYSAKEASARLFNYNGKVKAVFDEPQRAVTPGQSIVFYDGDVLLGGGKII